MLSLIPTSDSWQTELANLITEPAELLQLLQLDMSLLPQAQRASQLFPLRVPRAFVNRMQKANLDDPLLRQVLPLGAELLAEVGYSKDPLQEIATNPLPGLLHKYPGRVLLTLVGACAINCRYCFRRHFPYRDNNPGQRGWQAVLEYIANDPSINEVIFSGGDPLVANDKILAELAQQIAAINHVKILRIHTRLPIVMPSRITEKFIAWLTGTRLKPILVTHVNHAQELDNSVINVLQYLNKAGVSLLNQSVLLRGINDNVASLIKLSESLFTEAGVLPYYIHLLDKVQGAAHFDVAETTAKQLLQQMTQCLPGYLVPRLVKEEAGKSSKTGIIAY